MFSATMATDEQACLVAPRSDSENSCFGACKMVYTADHPSIETCAPGEHVLDTSLHAVDGDSGELIDCGDRSVLAQFHEEAIRQASCGPAQLRLVLVAGLALCGATVEQAVVPFILPSAEIELCIISNEKSWLGMISLLGLCVGAAGWGCLADRAGRHRTLVSCLAVNALFSAVAAFMPTYGTFMMARFCSAIGSGGIVPTVYSYIAELCTRAHRPRVLAVLPLLMGAGVLYAGAVAGAVVPHTGREALLENKEHFSAWHRYLLLCTLPILASLISLIWVEESPRYLLEAGREVDALYIYQTVHRRNRLVGSGGSEASSSLELEPPGKRTPRVCITAPQHVRYGALAALRAYLQLFAAPHVRTTVTLGGTLLFAMCVHYAVTAYVPATVLRARADRFRAARTTVANLTYEHRLYNDTIENVDFVDVAFRNCTFRDMFVSHVRFRNCSFRFVTFSNVKTSFTDFKGSLFVNSSLLETDLIRERDMDEWCVLRDTTFRGLVAECKLRADTASQLGPALTEQQYVAGAYAAAAPLALLPWRVRQAPIVLFGVCLLTPAIYILESETALYILEALFKLFISLAQFTVFLHIVESYPASLRCTAHGLMMSLVYAGGMVATTVYSDLYPSGYITATLVTAALAVMATIFSLKTKDTSSNLL